MLRSREPDWQGQRARRERPAAAQDNADAFRGLNAETVFLEQKGTGVAVDVFPRETQQRLISLKDRSMRQFCGWGTHAVTNRFNDRAVAASPAGRSAPLALHAGEGAGGRP